jgi:hypothetical protein
VRAGVDNSPVLDDLHLVEFAQGDQPVGDDQDGAPGGEPGE